MHVFDLPNSESKGPYVRPLSQTLREAEKALQEAEWNGEKTEAIFLSHVVETLRKRLDAGEMYDPEF